MLREQHVPGTREHVLYFVSPADLATRSIYNFNPVFSAGNTGQNQTIHLIGNADLYSHNDWTTFRSLFGLSGYTNASLTTIHPPPPSGPNNCSDPGTTGDRGEATIDVESSTAALRECDVILASCADASPTSGLLIALQNLISGTNTPAIIGESFLECEARLLAAGNAAQYAIFPAGRRAGERLDLRVGRRPGRRAVRLPGDSGDARHQCEWARLHALQRCRRWHRFRRYLCGNQQHLLELHQLRDLGLCQVVRAGNSVGLHLCQWASRNVRGVHDHLRLRGLVQQRRQRGSPAGAVGGRWRAERVRHRHALHNGRRQRNLRRILKPAWQTGVFGIPNDGVRDLPDVSLLAAQGPWGHAYTWCNSNLGACSNSKGEPNQWAFGTSVASPIMAGVQALINHQTGVSQGNPNYRYYQLAAHEYGTSGNNRLQFEPRQHGRSLLHLPRRHARRHGHRLRRRQRQAAQLLSAVRHLWRALDLEQCARVYGGGRLGFRHRYRHGQRFQSRDELDCQDQYPRLQRRLQEATSPGATPATTSRCG